MSKRNKGAHTEPTSLMANRPARRGRQTWAGVAVAVGVLAGLLIWRSQHGSRPAAPAIASSSNAPASADATLPSAEVAQSLMVTLELDFDGKLPSIEEALKDIERRQEPEDGRGRTFAILDAYGGPTPAKKLHLSMHLSLEKPGTGSLVFRRTGEVLWKSRIVPRKIGPPGEKSLTVIMDDGSGKSLMLDGSRGAPLVLDVPFRDAATRVRDVWPDGQEREFTFIYSVCGCPVKTKVRRIGEATMRTSELPVMFPDDPAAMAIIRHLMAWPGGG